MRSRFWTIAAILALSTASMAASNLLVVDQIGQVFDRTSLQIARGDRIVFNNHDDVTHNISVFTEDGDPTDLGLQKPGVSLKYKFDKSGLFTVRCSIHPSMKMSVAVK